MSQTTAPHALWDAPIPLIACVPDWQFQWHFARRALPRCQLAFTDALGVGAIRKAGLAASHPLNLFGARSPFTEDMPTTTRRDIDVLFVGNLNPAVQGERLPWLARLANMATRHTVVIRHGVYGEEYKRLLSRAKIVFNRSLKGEWNLRVGEACASGALLLVEAGNPEMEAEWVHRVHCAYYREGDLDALVDHYLHHEDERRIIAEAGRQKALSRTFTYFWNQGLATIRRDWGGVLKRLSERPPLADSDRLPLRVWQAMGATDSGDAGLISDLDAALATGSASLSLSCGRSVLALCRGRDLGARASQDELLDCARRLHLALAADPGHSVTTLNLVEILHAQGQSGLAARGAARLIGLVDNSPLTADEADSPRFPEAFDPFRVAWEEAAWRNADSPAREREAKRNLLKWRLHRLLASITGDLQHFCEAALLLPKDQVTRAALGCALARAGRLEEALPNLRAANLADPFDPHAARGLHQALLDTGRRDEAAGVARSRLRLNAAAPDIVPGEAWHAFMPRAGGALVTVVVLCCNEAGFSRLCLESVRRHTRAPYELVLVDNGSTDETPPLLGEAKSWPEPARVAVITNDKNVGFPAGCNQGIEAARGDCLVFLNNDTVVTECWLEGLLAHAGDGVGLVGPVSNYTAPPQLVEGGYDNLGGMEAFAAKRSREFAGRALEAEVLKGFCLLATREVIAATGGFDERFGLGFFDDDDLSLRARRAGFRLAVALGVFVHHFGSRTFAALGIDTGKQLEANLRLFREKWGDVEASRFRAPAPRPDAVVHAAEMPAGRTVSLCVIARDEEANIEACLDSAKDLVDEMVVVDTGSKDRTKELALAKGAKVYDFPWVDDFAAARNACLERATGSYIFWLDADDRIDDENREKLRALFATLPESENAAYSMKCRCLPDPVTGIATVVDHVRLFRRHPQVRWRYRVHEQILGAVRDSGGQVRFADATVLHTGYLDSALRQRKLVRDLRLIEAEYRDQPGDPFTLFNLGATFVEVGRHAEAVPHLRESLRRSHPGDSIVKKLYSLLAGCHLQAGRPDEALREVARGLAACPDDAELLFRAGIVRSDSGDLAGAKAAFLRLLGTRDGEHFSSVADGLRTFRGRHLLAWVCRRLGEEAEAEGLWRRALGECPGFVEARAGLGQLFLDQGRWAEAEEAAQELAATPQGVREACLLRARALFVRRDLQASRSLLEPALASWPDATPLWELYTFILLEEGRDLEAAERALVRLLELDPGNGNARRNLEVLRARAAARDQAFGGGPDFARP